MRAWIGAMHAMVLVTICCLSPAFAAESPEDFLNSLATLDSRHSPGGAGGTGEAVSLYTGALSFVVTDVSLPGNSELPVAFTRRFAVGSPGTSGKSLPLGDWSLDVPVIHAIVPGTVAGGYPGGWLAAGQVGTANQYKRCTYFGSLPQIAVPGGVFWPEEYTSGFHLDLPGFGRQTLLNRATGNTHVPDMTLNGQPVDFPVVTRNDTVASCIALSHGQGEGFLVVTPDGRQWRIDHLVYVKTLQSVEKPAAKSGTVPQANPSAMLDRWEARLYATRVTDRFGHWVEYHYDAADQLYRIDSDDGRRIDIDWQNGVIDTVTAQPLSASQRQWSYTVTGSTPVTRTLTNVAGPEGATTGYDLHSFAMLSPAGLSSGCGPVPAATPAAEDPAATTETTGSVTTAAGMKVKYTLASEIRGHADTPTGCWQSYVTMYPKQYRVAALQKREVSGAGLPLRIWHYDYSPPHDSWDVECSSTACPYDGAVWTEVTDPQSHVTKYTWSNRFDETEGQLLKTEWHGDGGAVLRTEARTYAAWNTGPWPAAYGTGPVARGNPGSASRRTPLKSRTIGEGGTDYKWAASAWDGYARPTVITRSSTGPHGSSVDETLAYDYNTQVWVLGQFESRTVNTPSTMDDDPVPEARSYRASNATLATISRFGQTVATYTWHPLGTGAAGRLHSHSDGLEQTTTYSNYHHGVPYTTTWADATSVQLTANDFGEVLTVTDERDHVTTVQRDDLGRITHKIFPADSDHTWDAVDIVYRSVLEDVAGDAYHEYGLAGRHWHVTVSRGAYRKDVVYDAALNPVVTSVRDTTPDPDEGTLVWKAFDFAGHNIFASWPLAWTETAPVGPAGVTTDFDALGRVTATTQDSELGPLSAYTNYPNGNTVTVTNPRGYANTTTYQAFDHPARDKPIRVEFPDGTVTTVSRDVYGKPLTMTQSGDYASYPARSVTHTFVYDSHQRLCKKVSPESGQTALHYDAAGRLVWSAQGLDALQYTPTACTAESSIPASSKITHGHDTRNRLLTVNYPADEPDTSFTYYDDGKVKTATRGASTWTSKYFNRGLLKSDTLGIGGESFELHYDYDNLGNLASEQYPSGRTIHYLPNALGQPTQVGSYATDLDYTPNGRLTDLTYGNGIIWQASYTTRNLLDTANYARDGTLLADRSFTWDENGNPLSITDSVNGTPAAADTIFHDGFEIPQAVGTDDRDYQYDSLDRLTAATSVYFGGTTTYRYDPLGNLRQRSGAGPDVTYTYDAATNHIDQDSLGRAWVYDRGNVTLAGTFAMVYNHANELTGNSIGTEFAYDARGWRVRKVLNGTTTYFIYDANHRLVARSVNGQTTEFIHLGARPIARIEGATTTYLHTDYQHSPLIETDANGTILRAPFYRAYGITDAEGIAESPGYAGTTPDPTGLNYMGARYYHPGSGRFLSIDPAPLNPMSPMGLNRYAYAASNPTRYTDPTGEVPVDTVVDLGYIIWDAGNFLGASAAVGVGWATGNEALMNAGLEGMGETGANLGIDAAAAVTPYLAAPVARIAAKYGDDAVDVVRMADSPTAGKKVDSATRKRILARDQNSDGSWTCATCGQTTRNPQNVHTGHITPRSKGGDLSGGNLRCEGAACNLSQGNRSAPKHGRTCAERGSCGAPYRRSD